MFKRRYLLLIIFAVVFLNLFSVKTSAAYKLSAPVMENAENTAGGITVSWLPVDGAEYYTVLRKANNGSWTKKITTSSTTWTDTSVISGSVYAYAVRCSTADGSQYTSSRDADGISVLCMRPRTPYFTMLENGLKITWSTAKGASQYNIYRINEADSNDTPDLIASTEYLYYIDTDLADGETYTYYIQPEGSLNGDSSFRSALDDSKSKSKTFFSVPVISSVLQKGYNVTISWDGINGAEAYTILRKVNDGSWVKKAVITDTTWTDSASKTSGNIYTYMVRCSNSEGTSYKSAKNNGIQHTYLKTPSIKSINSLAEGTLLKISGAAVTEYYDIYRSEGDGSFQYIGTQPNDSGSTLVNYTDIGVTDGMTYNYYVTANKNGTSIQSGTVSATYEMPSHTAYAAVSSVILYSDRDVNAETTMVIPYRTQVTYIEQTSSSSAGGWNKIEYKGDVWYYWQDADSEKKLKEEITSLEYDTSSQTEENIVNMALQIYGQNTTYRRGDSTGIPDSDGVYGYDCSGLVSYILRNNLRDLVPVYDYYAKVSEMYNIGAIYNKDIEGEFVPATITSIDDLRPGDLIFFYLLDEAGDVDESEMDSSYVPNHVGMYLGNNEFIHSTHYEWGGSGVFIMPLDDNYSSAITNIRRFVPDEAVPANKTVYVNASSVNIQREMDKDSEITDSIYGNTPLTLLYTNGTWAYIEYNGNYGFIYDKYLMDEQVFDEPENRIVTDIKKTIYKVPSSSSDEKSYVFAGESVEYLGMFFTSNYAILRIDDEIWYAYTPSGADEYFITDFEEYENRAEQYTITGTVKFRSSPSSDNDENVIEKIKSGTVVDLIVQNSSWAYIKFNGVYGFVSVKYIVPAD